jgi:hypothetical protein
VRSLSIRGGCSFRVNGFVLLNVEHGGVELEVENTGCSQEQIVVVARWAEMARSDKCIAGSMGMNSGRFAWK